jgi:membrane-associated protein
MTGGALGVADTVLDWLFTLDPWLISLFTALFTALETTALLGLVVPGDAVTLLAGSTVTTLGGYATVVLAATAGSLTGETGGYLLGRLVGGRLRHGRLGRRLGERRWSRAEAYLNGHGAPALAAARFVAVVHAVVPLVAGTVRMPFRRFIGWSALGALSWSALFTAIGVVAGTGYRQYGNVSLLATVAVVMAASLASVAQRLRGRRPPMGGGPVDPPLDPPLDLLADAHGGGRREPALPRRSAG